MLPGKNCNMYGGHVAQMIHDCFQSNIDIYMYLGMLVLKRNLPSLQQYRVIDMQWDFYYMQFNIEVK